MSLEDSLKKLAEKYPDRFDFVRFDKITQDGIDEMLFLIGWEYWVTPIDFEELVGTWTYHIRHVKSQTDWNVMTQYDSKLDAAQAALIAIVKKL